MLMGEMSAGTTPFAKNYMEKNRHRLSLSDLGLPLCRIPIGIAIDIMVKGAEDVQHAARNIAAIFG